MGIKKAFTFRYKSKANQSCNNWLVVIEYSNKAAFEKMFAHAFSSDQPTLFEVELMSENDVIF